MVHTQLRLVPNPLELILAALPSPDYCPILLAHIGQRVCTGALPLSWCTVLDIIVWLNLPSIRMLVLTVTFDGLHATATAEPCRLVITELATISAHEVTYTATSIVYVVGMNC